MALAAALDIGGANIKGSRSDGRSLSLPHALWKDPGGLSRALARTLEALSPFDQLAVTMTGELSDVYRTSEEGVRHILESAVGATRDAAPYVGVGVWLIDGRIVSPEEALESTRSAAAANWSALSIWAAALSDGGEGLLVDVGSTTTDVIALRDGAPHPVAWTDTERLHTGELVYTGARRTPICAVLREVVHRARLTGTAAEWFASMLDAYIVTGDLPEEPSRHDTADGREATLERAVARLARVVCADPAEFSLEEATDIAHQAAKAQEASLDRALARVIDKTGVRREVAVISGSGEFLARRLVAEAGFERVVSVSEVSSPEVSEAACAHALARIAAGMLEP